MVMNDRRSFFGQLIASVVALLGFRSLARAGDYHIEITNQIGGPRTIKYTGAVPDPRAVTFSFGPGCTLDVGQFENCTVVILKGDTYRRCVFRNCIIELRGGYLASSCRTEGDCHILIYDGMIGESHAPLSDQANVRTRRLTPEQNAEVARLGDPSNWKGGQLPCSTDAVSFSL
jgi:hypothetical protein